MITRYIEFFEGDNGRLSMTRLLCFLSFFPASYVVIADLSDSTLGWYLGAYVLGYVGGKGFDAIQNKATPITVENAETVKTENGDVNLAKSN